MELFVPPEACNIPQLLFLTVVYAVILYQASNLISGGSELLLFFPPVAGIVGSIVLPILGAVPDGVMVLFSGLGPDAQNQVSVGVGALAGSTVMLLTFPWFIAVVSGRVPLKDGVPAYGEARDAEPSSCMKAGVMYQESLQKAAKIMLGTTLLFLVIQLPATFEERITGVTKEQAKGESIPALTGLFLSIAAFCGYLWNCFEEANEDKQLAKVIEGIQKKQISIGAALRYAHTTRASGSKEEKLCDEDQKRLKKIVRPFFVHYDIDKSGKLDVNEFKNLLQELGERPRLGVQAKLEERDVNKDGRLDFDEIVNFLGSYLKDEYISKLDKRANHRYMPAYEEDEEEEEMPEDLRDLPVDAQLKRILFRSCWMMAVGTALVLIFSDPMVDILSNWGNRLNISPFYISFVLAPFASNASELLSAYNYARKKTQKSMTTALSTLVGAACMNNTFCLAIFLALVYFKDLAWQFTAETLAIVLIQWVIGLMTVKSQQQTVPMAIIILLCYPGCLFVVWFFENICGWD
mmetsp:Transcript_148979/g.415139  ORF Transcript_148979/g.415139 Transcript_148979/m.415139 type:complete len:521 (-) Transcript_148979:151-1713(-)|eukprot:CAMPEP_0179159054 /NCGR_PEP_ID=MMETSP0796-20121207/77642_1 /TAXON_ID=73915 /ORGANISM="Pyrodinium bahamense, Strain pbaha01" /LENGTH=520 /DNA_ID=CAMNT_0020860773 /DNA_START=72 /DNA_END=1634 /DNA_ORIENTATION=+